MKVGKCLSRHFESNDLYFYQPDRLADCLLAGNQSATTAFIPSAWDGFGGCTSWMWLEKQSFQRKWAQAWRLMQMCCVDMSGCVDQWDGAGAAATALSQRCAWSWGSGIPAVTGWWQSHCTRSSDTGTTLRPSGVSAFGRILAGFDCLKSRFYHGLVLDDLSALPSSTYRFSVSSLLLPSTHRSGHINMRIIEAETPGTSITLNHFCWTQLSTCRWRDSAEHLCKCYFFPPSFWTCAKSSRLAC